MTYLMPLARRAQYISDTVLSIYILWTSDRKSRSLLKFFIAPLEARYLMYFHSTIDAYYILHQRSLMKVIKYLNLAVQGIKT